MAQESETLARDVPSRPRLERLDVPLRWELGYLGTYSRDRQDGVEELLLEPARSLAGGRFVVAGPQYPDDARWPANVERLEHKSRCAKLNV